MIDAPTAAELWEVAAAMVGFLGLVAGCLLGLSLLRSI